MVQVVQGDTGWSDAFEQIGKGASEGYTNRSDQMAIQNALTKLPDNADMRQIINAITATKTYNPKAKQDVIKNYLDEGNLNAAIAKANRPPKTAVADTPITPDQQVLLDEVTGSEEYKNANIPGKQILFNKKGVSRANSKPILEAEEAQEKLKIDQDRIDRKEQVVFHKETEKYDEELDKNARAASKQLQYLADVDKAIEKVSTSDISNILSFFGEKGKALGKAFQTTDQATFAASVPVFLEGMKEIFGVRLSDADLKILQDKLPDIGRSKEANREISRIMKKYARQSVLRNNIAAQVKRDNRGLRGLDYKEKINERFDELTQPVKMIAPGGEEIDVEAFRVSDALQEGAKLVQNE